MPPAICRKVYAWETSAALCLCPLCIAGQHKSQLRLHLNPSAVHAEIHRNITDFFLPFVLNLFCTLLILTLSRTDVFRRGCLLFASFPGCQCCVVSSLKEVYHALLCSAGFAIQGSETSCRRMSCAFVCIYGKRME